ncbi:SUMF1/EgtB/PvdO family nonheme iron enzyme, partial [bacterium]|nr:SUMF1/EgtB/PvdO family nonheme iron enzyme [bacterium]
MKILAIVFLLTTVLSASAELEIPEGMVLVPGARFAMGVSQLELEDLAKLGKDVPHLDNHYRGWFLKEMPLHEVRVDSFYLDAYEVTNGQFALFVEETGYEAEGNWREHLGDEREEHPVVRVTWNDAQAYAAWAGCRLPTEAEWEWAARGGKVSRWFPWGEKDDKYSLANYGHERSFWGGVKGLLGFQRIATDEVGHFSANGYGLYDMSGNVAEWCAD